MARRKKTDNGTRQSVPSFDYNYSKREANGSVGLSKAAQEALFSGTYGKTTNRKPTSINSSDQAKIANPVPVLTGTNVFNETNNNNKSAINTDRARAKYAEKHTPVGTKNLSQKDADLLYDVFSKNRLNLGNRDTSTIVTQLKNNIWNGNYVRNNDWEGKYGKSLEELVEDYSKDFDKIAERKDTEYGQKHRALATLGNVFRGGTVEPALDLEATIFDTIGHDSNLGKLATGATERYSKEKRNVRNAVTSDMGSTGKQLYDLGTGVAERVIEYANPSAAKYALQFGKSTENKRQELKEQGKEGGKAKAHSLITGGVDAALDWIGLDKIPALKNLASSGNLGKEVLGRFAIGGGEQGLTELIDMGLDRAFYGDESAHSQKVAMYKAQGMSDEDAEKQANIDDAKELGQAALSGGLLNNVMGIGGRAVNKAFDKIPSLWSSRTTPDVDTTPRVADVENAPRIPEVDNAIRQAEDASAEIERLTDQIPKVEETTAPVENVAPRIEPTERNYKIETVNRQGGKKGYFVSETLADGSTRNIEPGKVYKTEAEAQKALDNINNQETARLNDAEAEEPNRTMNESVPGNPRLVKKLEGDELKEAQNKVKSNNSKAKALQNEIKILEDDKSNYRSGKLTKNAKAEINAKKAEIKALKDDNRLIRRQINGEPTPVIEQLDPSIASRVNDFKREVQKIGNMWVGENGKQLAKEVNDSLDRYIESGKQEDFNAFARDLWQLHTSATGEYTSKAGNVSRYSDYYGDVEDGIFGATIKDDGLLPNKAIRDFHSAMNERTRTEEIGDVQNSSSTAEGDSGMPPEPPSNPNNPNNPVTDISRRYETLKNSDLFQKSQANMKLLEKAKDQGVFNKDVEDRASAQQEALEDYINDPQTTIERNLNRSWDSGKDVDTSMLILHDALEDGSQAYTNLVLLKQAQQAKKAGRQLRAYRDYSGTKEGTIQKAGEYLNDKADEVLSSRKARADIQNTAERVVEGDYNLLSQKYGMDEQNIKNIVDALGAGASKDDVVKMIAMYQSVGKTGVSPEALQKVRDIYDRIESEKLNPNSRARAELEADAFKILADDIGGKNTWREKWNSWRYLAMLGNPKTHLRNILGNTTHRMVTEVKDNIGAVIESAVSKFSQNGIERTKALLNSNDRGLINLAAKDADDVAYGALNDMGNKYNVKTEIERARNSFDSKLLSKIDSLNSKALDVEDYNALKKKYSRSLARFLKANGADGSIFDATDDASRELLERGRSYAIDQAKQATFHAYSRTADALTQLSKNMSQGNLGNKAVGAVLEGLVPFKKTPINILKQGAKYSPYSLATSIVKGFDAIKTGNRTATDVIEDLSSGLTGTGIMIIGGLLAHQGFLTGGANPNYDVDNAETEQGSQNYALKIGNKSYTIDWLAPMALPLFVGAELINTMGEGSEDDKDVIDKFITAVSTVAEPITEMSMLQGIQNVLNELSYSKENVIATFGTNAILGYATQGVPTLAGQIARTIDNTRRSTYTDQPAGYKRQVDKTLTKTQNKIPFLSMFNEPYVGASGTTEASSPFDNVFGNLAYQMLSPGYYKNGTVSPVDEELNRLYESTGENVYKNVSSGKIGNDPQKLSKTDFTKYQTLYGQNTDAFYNDLVNSQEYNSLDDAARVKALSEAKSVAKMIADYEIGGKELKESEQKIYDIYKADGKDGILQYLKDSAMARSLDMRYDTYVKKEAETPGGAAQYSEDKQKANALGISVDTYRKKQAESPDGAVQYAEEKAEAKQYDLDVKQYEKVLKQAGAQSDKVLNDLPSLIDMGLPKSSYYVYANAVNIIPSLQPTEFAQTYNEINTNTENAITQKELLEYINSFDYDDPSEAVELWDAYGGWTKKDGTPKKIKMVDGIWKSYY